VDLLLPVDGSSSGKDGVIFSAPGDSGHRESSSVALELDRLRLADHDGPGRVVGDDRRPPDEQVDVGGDLVGERDDHLALVDAGVRLLDVLDLQGVGRTGRVEPQRETTVPQDQGAAGGNGQRVVRPVNLHPQHRILLRK